MCDSYGRSVFAVQGCFLPDSGQSQLEQEQFTRAGCLMMAGVGRWDFHECNKPGQLREDCSVYKKRIAEKGNKPEGESVETTTVVQVVMDETWKFEDDDYVFVFGSEVSADVQRRDTQLYRWCIYISMSFSSRV